MIIYSDSSQVDSMAYFFRNDTLVLSRSLENPCEEGIYYYDYYYYFDSYDECFEYSELGAYAFGVNGIQDFHQDMTLYYTAYDVVSTSQESIMPLDYKVFPAYPNPFNPVTNLNYHLPEDSFVRITIYDTFGNEINKLIDSKQSRGQKSVQWNATNNQGKPVSAGVYLYRIQAGDFVDNRKMILLK